VPSGSVKVATSGDFSPGARPGFLDRLASMDTTGLLARETASPIRTFTLLHPHRTSREVNPKQATISAMRGKTSDLHLLMIGLTELSAISKYRLLRRECRAIFLKPVRFCKVPKTNPIETD
jgi:hypothetical protein